LEQVDLEKERAERIAAEDAVKVREWQERVRQQAELRQQPTGQAEFSQGDEDTLKVEDISVVVEPDLSGPAKQ
jgi:hypothetical protein